MKLFQYFVVLSACFNSLITTLAAPQLEKSTTEPPQGKLPAVVPRAGDFNILAGTPPSDSLTPLLVNVVSTAISIISVIAFFLPLEQQVGADQELREFLAAAVQAVFPLPPPPQATDLGRVLDEVFGRVNANIINGNANTVNVIRPVTINGVTFQGHITLQVLTGQNWAHVANLAGNGDIANGFTDIQQWIQNSANSAIAAGNQDALFLASYSTHGNGNVGVVGILLQWQLRPVQ